ncbi:MAG: PD-(D/E)XK nuclease family protein [Woeseia sp.]
MTGHSHYQWLHDALADGATVLTSSRRLALELRHEFDQQQITRGLSAWPSADIYFWQEWLQHKVEEQTGVTERRLLDGPSSVLLWERCLDRAVQADLLSTTSLVRHARRAWQRLQEWQVSLAVVREAARSRDEHWFVGAAQRYQQQLDDAGWLDVAQLATYCSTASFCKETQWPAGIVYAGFERLTPAQHALFSGIGEQGCATRAAPQAALAAQLHYRSYADANTMWRAAGCWARELLEQNPLSRIAIVAPDLESDATGIAGEVREGFAPGWQLAGGRYRDAVDVSYGMPLALYPAIGVAGLCLRLACDGLNSTDVSVLLRSGFIGDADIAERARLDWFLRSLPDRQWLPANLSATLRPRIDDESAGLFLVRLEKIAELYEQRQQQRSPADWAQSIDEMLTAIGWPGESQPDSAEFQLQNRWRQLLNDVARLGSVRSSMTLPDCLRCLMQIAGETLYQPESRAGGLRLLGMLEAVGLEFDYLWLGGMDASRWPTTANPLALVNRQLQRERGMPDATPADALQFSQRILQRVLIAANQVEVSWARLEDDKELLPSPLLDVEGADPARDTNDPGWHATTLLGSPTVAIPADKAPPVLPDERISGGAYTVQSMREEPFKAFAEGRLHVRDLDIIQPGFSPRMRGTLVHGALQQLLRELPAQADLKRWSSDQCVERIDKAAWQPLAKHWPHADPVLQRLLQLEKRRLEQLLHAFIQKENEREDFQVLAVESSAKLDYGPVHLRLRIDRLDRLADGALLITDYKASDAKSFLERKYGRPKQLQLCVYARALEDDSVGGLQLTYVNSSEIRYVGEGGSISHSKVKPEDWSALLEDWCAEVDVLLKRFADGETGINALQEIKKARSLAVLSRFAELASVN